MRKGALLLALLMVASSPALAAAKKKHAKAQPVQTAAVEDSNANAARLLREGWPLILPTSLQVLYFSTHSQADTADAAKATKSRKK
jgi:hypothetical protein